MNHICKFCGKTFDKGIQLGGHVARCKLNPNSKNTFKKISNSKNGKSLSQSHKQNISNSINKQIKIGNWHNSFAKKNIKEYKGEKLHGNWELKYAEFLDKNDIKWSRPNERFWYAFEGKNRFYIPDFYLIEEEIYIEIKGCTTLKDIEKWKYFPFKLRVLEGIDLIKTGVIEDHFYNNRKSKLIFNKEYNLGT
jgi:hypothetical protein